MSKAQGYEINTSKLESSASVCQLSAFVGDAACVCPLVLKTMNCQPVTTWSKYIDSSKRQQQSQVAFFLSVWMVSPHAAPLPAPPSLTPPSGNYYKYLCKACFSNWCHKTWWTDIVVFAFRVSLMLGNFGLCLMWPVWVYGSYFELKLAVDLFLIRYHSITLLVTFMWCSGASYKLLDINVNELELPSEYHEISNAPVKAGQIWNPVLLCDIVTHLNVHSVNKLLMSMSCIIATIKL